jgi:hypothetical protein
MLYTMLMSSVGEAWRFSYFWKRYSDLFMEVQSIRRQLAPIVFMDHTGQLPNTINTMTVYKVVFGKPEVNKRILPNFVGKVLTAVKLLFLYVARLIAYNFFFSLIPASILCASYHFCNFCLMGPITLNHSYSRISQAIFLLRETGKYNFGNF